MPSPNPAGTTKEQAQARAEVMDAMVAGDNPSVVAKKLMMLIRKGNVLAIRTWLEHVLGKRLEVTGKDGKPIETRSLTRLSDEDLAQMEAMFDRANNPERREGGESAA